MSDLENEGRTDLYFLPYLWLYTSYRRDLCVDSNIFEAWDIKNVEINFVSLTVDLETRGHMYI